MARTQVEHHAVRTHHVSTKSVSWEAIPNGGKALGARLAVGRRRLPQCTGS